MFSAIYFNICFYTSWCLLLLSYLFMQFTTSFGLMKNKTVYQWIRRVWNNINVSKVGLAQSLKEEIFQIKDARATRTKSL